jgi:hypothetical protein
MKKLILLTLLLTACGGSPSRPVIDSPVVVPTEPALQSYQSADYGFSFQYPSEWLNKSTDASYSTLGESLVVLELPKASYEGTNFGDATFSVNAQYVDSLEACLALSTSVESTEVFAEDKFETVNGLTYFVVSGSGAGAGNLYESKYDRAFVNGSCFEVVQTLHTTNIGNYDGEVVTEVNAAHVWERMDTIFQTLTF